MFGSSLMFLRIQERLEGAKASARKIAVFNAMRYRNYRFYWFRRYHGAGHGLFGGRIPASGTPTGAMNMATKTRPQGAVGKSREAFLPQP
jgi:hypothetical protein